MKKSEAEKRGQVRHAVKDMGAFCGEVGAAAVRGVAEGLHAGGTGRATLRNIINPWRCH